MKNETILYRFFAADDRLLYVGISYRIESRFGQHRQLKPWDEIARIELEHYPTRDSALVAEREAIENESPEWNKMFAAERSPGLLVWPCMLCKRPIGDGEGYLHVEWEAAVRSLPVEYAPDWEETDQRIRTVVLSDLVDDRLAWQIHHVNCDPNPSSDDYWIPIEHIRTWPNLVQTAAHLSNKQWVRFTRWSEFLYWIVAAQREDD